MKSMLLSLVVPIAPLTDPPIIVPTAPPVLSDVKDNFHHQDLRFMRLSLLAIGFKVSKESILEMPVAGLVEKLEWALEHSLGCSGNDQLLNLRNRLQSFA